MIRKLSHPCFPFRLALLAALLSVAAGCDELEVRSYTVPKDDVPPEPISWEAPESWIDVLSLQQMRYATFLAPVDGEQVQITVTQFSGNVGSLDANVNRWRRQIGLPPLPPEDAIDDLTPAETATGDALQAHLSNPRTGQHVLIYMFATETDTWFVKAEATAAQVDAIGPQLEAFVETIEPRGGVSIVSRLDRESGSRPRLTLPTLDAPESWQPIEPAPRGTVLGYRVTTTDPPARVTVSQLMGTGGGLLANINRWRGQVGLDPIADPADQPAEQMRVDGGLAGMLQFAGPPREDGSQRGMIVVMAPRQQRTWFFKADGDADSVQRVREQFVTFVQSADFEGAGVE